MILIILILLDLTKSGEKLMIPGFAHFFKENFKIFPYVLRIKNITCMTSTVKKTDTSNVTIEN